MARLTPVLVALALLACAPSATQRRDESTRGTMQAILAALEVALPSSLSEERFSDPSNRAQVGDALRVLAGSSAALDSHGHSAGFRALRETLAHDAAEVSRRYDAGQFPEARFLLDQITQDCVACHTRLPGPSSQLGARLVASVGTGELSDLERVRLAVATRQFDAALTACEHLFAQETFSLESPESQGLLLDYLVIAVRVREQPARALHTLEALDARDASPRYLRQELHGTVEALRDLLEDPPIGSPFEQARSLMERGEQRTRFPADRAPLVDYLAASGRLEALIEAGALAPDQQAWAYYWLGLTESVLRWPTWASPRFVYLEEAIRLDPRGPAAEPAFSLLVLELTSAYGGSQGVYLPDDELEMLDELYQLMDAE